MPDSLVTEEQLRRVSDTAIAVMYVPVIGITALFTTPYMLYVAMGLFVLSALWFQWRNVVGYVRYLRRAPA